MYLPRLLRGLVHFVAGALDRSTVSEVRIRDYNLICFEEGEYTACAYVWRLWEGNLGRSELNQLNRMSRKWNINSAKWA